jgi:hypothetical protein
LTRQSRRFRTASDTMCNIVFSRKEVVFQQSPTGLDSSWYPFHFLDSIHLLWMTPILYSKKLVKYTLLRKYLKLRLSEVYIRLAKYLVRYFVSTLYVCDIKHGMEIKRACLCEKLKRRSNATPLCHSSESWNLEMDIDSVSSTEWQPGIATSFCWRTRKDSSASVVNPNFRWNDKVRFRNGLLVTCHYITKPTTNSCLSRQFYWSESRQDLFSLVLQSA